MDGTKIRNIGIVAHIDAGKTTTTERVLYYTGKNYRIGEVDEGSATMDWMVQEQERGITITSAATTCHWKRNGKDFQINIIDTPGHVDFTIEVERSLRILDGAIVVVCGVSGIQAQTETVWAQTDRHHVARLLFINKLDRRGADFYRLLPVIEKKFGLKPLPITIPFGQEENLRGVIHVLEEKLILYNDEADLGKNFKLLPVPEAQKVALEKCRAQLIEGIAEFDDELLALYLDGKPLPKAMLIRGIRKATVSRKIIPVFAGSAFRNKGIQSLLDGVVDFLPDPFSAKPVVAWDEKEVKKPVAMEVTADPLALLFKVQVDPFSGLLYFLRVYAGKLEVGKTYWNSVRKKRERILKLFRIHAKEKTEVASVEAGDIAAAVGLQDSYTGDTFSTKENSLFLEPIVVPRPVISAVIELKQRADLAKLMEYLNRLEREDPSLQIKQDKETGQTVLYGMGELHLEVAVDRIKREAKVDLNIGRQQVSFRETLTISVLASELFDKPILGKVSPTKVEVRLSPQPTESNQVVVLPDLRFFPQIAAEIKTAAEEALLSGVVGGYGVIQTLVEVIKVEFPPEGWQLAAIKIALAGAIRKCLVQGQCILLAPEMRVEVDVPKEFMGAVINDLNSCDAKVVAVLEKDFGVSIEGEAPLERMLGYTTKLRSLTQGKGSFTMEFSRFAPRQKGRT